MRPATRRYVKSQGGYTLIEVIITAALGALLMSAVVSVVLTTVRATSVATSRVQASGQVRNFEYFAYSDFAASGVPSTGACGTPSTPCTTQPLVLTGTQVSNSSPPVASPYQVTYVWDGTSFLDRQVAGATRHVATDVSAFAWYVDTGGALPTVVVTLTVQVQSYAESQTFRFYPRVNP